MDAGGEHLMDQPEAIIRGARPGDARAIEEVIQRAYAEYRGRVKPPFQALSATAEEIAAEIRVPGRGYLVAEVGPDIVGALRYRRMKVNGRRVMELSRLAVDPDYRQLGLGRRLMAEAERRALRAGITELRGNVRAVLKGLLDYYGRMGFRPLGRRSKPGYPRYLIVIGKRLPEGAPGIK